MNYRSMNKKEREKYDEERHRRTKCRATNPPPSTCKNCSQTEECAIEGTQDWLSLKRVV